MKIILAMICGRESAHIESCLRAFAPAFDGLALVLALGNQEPDDTEAKAREICAELGKDIVVGRYHNARDTPEFWPHVDDFGAARQRAFVVAVEMDADWIFWADADDTVCPTAEIADLRKIAASGEASAYGFPYDVVGTGKRPVRERLYRASLFARGEAAWEGAIHENIVGPKVCARHAPVWRHSPHPSKGGSKERNLRLLKHAVKSAAVQAFYIHQEHAIRGEWAEALRWGSAALAMPGLPDPFRYEVALNHVRQGPRADAEKWVGQAFAMFPACREALAFLALIRMEEGRFEEALTIADRLTGIAPPPVECRPWGYDPKWYGWAARDLRARLLRLVGRPDEGDHEENLGRDLDAPAISLIHATRGRHQQALACRERWLNAADNPAMVETVWCVDEDDAPSVTVSKQFRRVVVPAGGGCVAAWNAGAAIATGRVLVQLSDDWHPPQGWDTAILREIGDTTRPAVLAVSDGHRTDDLLCMAILTRARWEQQGREMFSPEYKSVYSDNEFSHRAWKDGVVIDARARLAFEHAHPAFGKAAMDATYAASNSAERYADGLATYRRRNPDAPDLSAALPAAG